MIAPSIKQSDSQYKWHLAITLIICLTVLMLVSFLPREYQGQGYDYLKHLNKAKQGLDYTYAGMNTYPRLFHEIAHYFTFREKHYYLFYILLIGLITPLLLFFLTKHWISTLFYFTTTSYFYFFEGGLPPFTLIAIYLQIMLLVKDIRIRIPLLFLGLATHSLGFQCLAIVLIILLLHEHKMLPKITLKTIPFLPCSGYFPTDRPNEILDTRIIPSTSNEARSLRVSYFGRLALDIFPIPFMIIAFRELWKEKKELFSLAIFFLILGMAHYRIFFLIPLVAIPGLVIFYQKLSHKNKKYLIAFSLIYGIFQVYIWLNYKIACYPLNVQG